MPAVKDDTYYNNSLYKIPIPSRSIYRNEAHPQTSVFIFLSRLPSALPLMCGPVTAVRTLSYVYVPLFYSAACELETRLLIFWFRLSSRSFPTAVPGFSSYFSSSRSTFHGRSWKLEHNKLNIWFACTSVVLYDFMVGLQRLYEMYFQLQYFWRFLTEHAPERKRRQITKLHYLTNKRWTRIIYIALIICHRDHLLWTHVWKQLPHRPVLKYVLKWCGKRL